MQLFTMGIGRSTMLLSGKGSCFPSAPSAQTECDLRYFGAHHQVSTSAPTNERKVDVVGEQDKTTELSIRFEM
jgi:hypothetical protein